MMEMNSQATLGNLITEVRKRLTPVFDRREREAVILLIFSFVKGWSRVDLIMNEGKPVSDFTCREVNAIVDRLILGEPIQYISGEARFHGLDFHVEPGVLIPRPETDELVDWILEDNSRPDLRVLDIGTGSGCIAVSLARTLPFAQVEALDFSREALRVAGENARKFGAKVNFIEADFYDWMPAAGSIDILVSNPPYIAPDEKAGMEVRVRDFEPSEALFVEGTDPLRPYRRLEAIAREGLDKGGAVYLELNPRFAAEVESLFINDAWGAPDLRRDSYGKVRMLRAVKLY